MESLDTAGAGFCSPARREPPSRTTRSTRLDGDGIRLEGSASGNHIRDNIVWTQNGYDLYVANDSQLAFDSDYNDLFTNGDGRGRVVAEGLRRHLRLDDRSRLRSALNRLYALDPTLDNPQFVNLSADDYHLTNQVSTSIDAGDPAQPFALEPASERRPDRSWRLWQYAPGGALPHPITCTWSSRSSTPIGRWRWNGRSLAGLQRLRQRENRVVPGRRGQGGRHRHRARGRRQLQLESTSQRHHRRYVQAIPDSHYVRIRPDDHSPIARAFAVPIVGNDFYVDDQSNVGDEYTPNASRRQSWHRQDAVGPQGQPVVGVQQL